MAEETTFGEIGGREWLTYSHKGKEGKFAFPPVQGTHEKCYRAINADSEIIPAEGAEIFVRTARDNKKIPYSWGVNIKDIKQPEQRVVVLGEFGVRLLIYGDYWGDDYAYAFGVSKTGKASAQKIF